MNLLRESPKRYSMQFSPSSRQVNKPTATKQRVDIITQSHPTFHAKGGEIIFGVNWMGNAREGCNRPRLVNRSMVTLATPK
jgi:hypothetical protein